MDSVAHQTRPRIFIDLSTSLGRLGQQATGITRTEGEIARRLLADPQIRPVPVAFVSGRIFALDLADAFRLVDRPSTLGGPSARATGVGRRLTSPAAPKPKRKRSSLRAVARVAWRRVVRFAFANSPLSIHHDLDAILLHAREIVRKTVRPANASSAADIETGSAASSTTREAIFNRCVEIDWPEAGDLLWTCGNYEVFVPLRRIAEARDRLGFSCVAICYGVVRPDRPERSPGPAHRLLCECVAVDLLDVADRVLCISADTRSGLLEFASGYGRDSVDARVIALGREKPPVAPAASLPQELVGRRFALCLGTIDRNSNVDAMVRIWDGLSDRPGFDLDLVLVGRASDPGETIVREVEASPLLGRRIFWFDECSDDVLGLLCGQADMLLSPNLAEGWGAPVLDALALGTPVVMSNAGTIPADLTRAATILDPDDGGAWQTAILTAATSARPQLPSVVPPTWDAAGAVIVSQLLDIACVRIP